MWYYWAYTGYEQYGTCLFCELLQYKCNIFDVGSNMGYYTLLVASLTNDRGQVYAF